MIDLMDNTLRQLSKFRTKYSVKINDDLRGMYNINSQIKFKNSMSKSRLCDYSDGCELNYNTANHRNSSIPKSQKKI